MGTTKAKTNAFRFVCSRYREERCPRISQTAVDNAETLTMFDANEEVTKEIDVGTVAVVECITGYKRAGPATSKCQGDGTWTALPTCIKPVSEQCPRISQTAVDYAETLTMFDANDEVTKEIDVGTVAVFECITGYKRAGPETSKCQGDGTWTALPTCIKLAVNCKMLTKSDIPNSKSVSGVEVVPGYAAPGSTLKVKCAKKHKYKKSGDFTCTNGEWVNIPSCEKKGKKSKSKK